MSIFEDREHAFEAIFVRDQELEFRAMARRNKLVGLWAAEKLGLTGPAADDYALEVIRADFDEPGDQDVLRKLARDLTAAGFAVNEGEIRTRMDHLLAEARHLVHTGG